MRLGKPIAAGIAILALAGTAPHHAQRTMGSFKLSVPSGPFISGSRLQVDALGVTGPLSLSVVGPGAIEGRQFIAPLVGESTTTTLVAATHGALAYSTLNVVPPPPERRPLLAVAAYESGVALHDPKTFALLGYAPIGGPPGDAAFTRSGDLYAPDTDGDTVVQIARAPWSMRALHGVPVGNEVAVDDRTGNIFITNRDINGHGALTRVTPDGRISRVVTGDTAEGLAVDSARGMVYAGNVNDDSVAQVDVKTMHVVRKIRSVERTFGIALDSRTQRLYVVSNTSPSMPSGGGYVAAIDLRRSNAPIIMKNRAMKFPLGIALDERRGRLFVTDESTSEVYVLSARNLRTLHAPLQTCSTPWRPRVAAGRLYVPCARANSVDVFELRTLRRVAGAPFATGGFPLSVALWP